MVAQAAVVKWTFSNGVPVGCFQTISPTKRPLFDVQKDPPRLPCPVSSWS